MTETPDQSTSWGSMLAGLVVGAAIGAAAALLYAPQSGKETREDILERLDDVKARVDEATRAMTEAARVKLAETRTDLSQAVNAGRAAARARTDELRQKAGLE